MKSQVICCRRAWLFFYLTLLGPANRTFPSCSRLERLPPTPLALLLCALDRRVLVGDAGKLEALLASEAAGSAKGQPELASASRALRAVKARADEEAEAARWGVVLLWSSSGSPCLVSLVFVSVFGFGLFFFSIFHRIKMECECLFCICFLLVHPPGRERISVLQGYRRCRCLGLNSTPEYLATKCGVLMDNLIFSESPYV